MPHRPKPVPKRQQIVAPQYGLPRVAVHELAAAHNPIAPAREAGPLPRVPIVIVKRRRIVDLQALAA